MMYSRKQTMGRSDSCQSGNKGAVHLEVNEKLATVPSTKHKD